MSETVEYPLKVSKKQAKDNFENDENQIRNCGALKMTMIISLLRKARIFDCIFLCRKTFFLIYKNFFRKNLLSGSAPSSVRFGTLILIENSSVISFNPEPPLPIKNW